tara:strand:+ start:1056 stop:1316 length:261 start_codon:yes stop_codon:yes gene_type:complete
MNSIEKLMSHLHDRKEDIKDGTYISVCRLMMDIKTDIDNLKKTIRRNKKNIFQKTMMASCLLDHITECEYDSDDDVEIYLQWGVMP